MIFMRNFVFKLKVFLIAVLFAICFLCAIGLTLPHNFVHASNGLPTATLNFPNTDLEYKELTLPSDVCSDDIVTAIVQNNQSLLIYTDGEYKAPLTNFISIRQVKKADDDTLLVSDNGSIYSIKLSNLADKTSLQATNNDNIGGNYFDISEKYLVTAYGSKGLVYERISSDFEYKGYFSLNGDYPVAINENGDIFFVKDDFRLYTLNVENLSSPDTQSKISNVSPSKMIADNDYVYYIYNDQVCRLSLNSGITTILPVDGKLTDFQLGNLKTPSGLTFKNNNLFITDSSLNAVQEFKVSANDSDNGYCLYFTGFAIASGKSSYNRISSSAIDVEKCGRSFAVLDTFKLTVYNPLSADKYARENFKNYFAKDFDSEMPQAFALGNNTALLSFGHNTSSGKIALLDIEKNQLTDKQTIFVGNIIRDVCYQSGYYYVLANNGALTQVYKVSEKDFSFDKELFSPTISATHITVDVFGNVFLANSVTGEVVFCQRSSDFAPTTIGNIDLIDKLSTDLGGNLYILADGSLLHYDGTSVTPLDLSPLNQGDKIKAVAMDFDQKDVSLIYDLQEYVCYTKDLNNFALSDATVSDNEYVITSNTAVFGNFKTATVIGDANVYSVQRTSPNFTFNGLISPEKEYAYICDIVLGTKLTLSALAGSNGVVLVDKSQLTISAPVSNISPDKAFVTTDVCVYYLPIITDNGYDYALFDSQTVRLEKSTVIEPIATITFLNQDFYFAKATIDGKDYHGYIPVNFTVEVLSENFKWNDYTIEKVEKTTLYLDIDCSSQIMGLNKGQSVRVLSNQNGICKVAVKLDDGSFIEGYIFAKALQNEPNRAVRNILIILAVTASVCGTMSYFVLRKKY